MTAEALVIAVLGFLSAGLLWDRRRVRGRIRQIDDAVARCGIRIDKLQRMVIDRGWRDSALLTRFDWRKPEDRG